MSNLISYLLTVVYECQPHIANLPIGMWTIKSILSYTPDNSVVSLSVLLMHCIYSHIPYTLVVVNCTI